MKLKEGFAKPTYRDRTPEASHYSVALFLNEELESWVYDEYDRVPVFAFEPAAEEWIHQRGSPEHDWRVVPVNIVLRK